MADNRALALLSDVNKSNYNGIEGFYQISPQMFQRINELYDGKNGNVRALLIYLICQQQNGTFRPAEATICRACNMAHAQYVNARKRLVEDEYIEYIPNQYIKILYKNIMEPKKVSVDNTGV